MKRDLVKGLLFSLLSSLLIGSLYASFGFNPTDDGFILAGSRRLLAGQWPHIDFLSIRPIGSHLFHLPLLLFGKYAALAGRYFFIFQMAWLSWCWWRLIAMSVEKAFASSMVAFVLCSALFIGLHDFAFMPWHSLDALFFFSTGLYLIRIQGLGILGMVLIGCSLLFRQNMIFVIPLIALIWPFEEKRPNWLWSLVPIGLYLLVLSAAGGFSDTIDQMFGQERKLLFDSSLRRFFLNSWWLAGVFLGWMLVVLHHRSTSFHFVLGKLDIRFPAALSVLYLLMLIQLMFGTHGDWNIYHESSFLFHGILGGALVQGLSSGSISNRMLRLGLMIWLLGVFVALSIGYNSPGFLGGPIILFLLIHFWPQRERQSESSMVQNAFVLALILPLFLLFNDLRKQNIYRERSAWHLNNRLGDGFASYAGVRSNETIYALDQDLALAIQKAAAYGNRYAIVPDMSAHWIGSDQLNPLALDWPQNTELANGMLWKPFLERSQWSGTALILSKFHTAELAYEKRLIGSGKPLVDYVRANSSLVDSTTFFHIYSPLAEEEAELLK